MYVGPEERFAIGSQPAHLGEILCSGRRTVGHGEQLVDEGLHLVCAPPLEGHAGAECEARANCL